MALVPDGHLKLFYIKPFFGFWLLDLYLIGREVKVNTIFRLWNFERHDNSP